MQYLWIGLGGFTTFSTLSFDNFLPADRDSWTLASLNFVDNTVPGLIGVVLGIWLGQLMQSGGQ
ncbi:MAG: hypothetical protein R3264_15875 [Anaerolineae bacterium]|nr:hypothetical protein [Anaerolineae bacterium]